MSGKRAYNVSILIKNLKMPIEKLKENILSMNEEELNEVKINALKAIAPTPEEVNLFFM